ncbi:protein cereblon-like isoform X2 [Megalopta genalis]|uniref:protein cereblon-like isoform X2 n=1 Tax=Megalopta genalis TaxID=115081 RepID=UPI003FCFE8CE
MTSRILICVFASGNTEPETRGPEIRSCYVEAVGVLCGEVHVLRTRWISKQQWTLTQKVIAYSVIHLLSYYPKVYNTYVETFMEKWERYLREYNYLESEGESEEEPLERTFDLSLPATHSYFGLNLEELRGRTIFDEGIYIKLPILEQKSVLFPGQTLPMKIRTHAIDMLSFLQSTRTIGVVCFGCYNVVPYIGVTAEISECKSFYPEAGYNFKAMGRQRFKILQFIIQGYDRISANVKILPEITLGPPFLDERLASLDRFRMKSTTEDFKRQEWVENRDAVVTPWPGWVYRQYDPLRLSLQIRRHLQLFHHNGANIPEDPTNLSFWIAQNLLLTDEEKNVLLRYDCAVSRLQMEMTCYCML